MAGKCRMIFFVALFFAIAAASPLAWSSTLRNDVDSSAYAALLASNPAYQSVGVFYGTTSTYSFRASGTVIAQDATSAWVLTAGHVVSGTTSLRFNLDGDAVTYNAVQMVAYPKWNGNLSSGTDIALVKLDKATSALPVSIYTGKSELGQVGTFVGYGLTGTGLTGAVSYSGKHAVNNLLDSYYRTGRKTTSSILLADFDSPDDSSLNFIGSADPLTLEGLIAPGDSGGGVFIDLGGQTYLAGVNSFLWAPLDGNPDATYGDVSGDIRVSTYADWIQSVIAPPTPQPPGPKPRPKPKSSFLGEEDGGSRGADDSGPIIPEPVGTGLIGLALLALRRRRAEPGL